MIQLPFPSTIEAQPCSITFLTIKTVVREIQKNDGQMGSCAWTMQCLDKVGRGYAETGAKEAKLITSNRPQIAAHIFHMVNVEEKPKKRTLQRLS